MNACCQFIANLVSALRENPLGEKLLLVPSHRVGRQWLDQAARLGGGFVNVRPVTIKRLIRDYAEPVLRRRNLRPVSRPEAVRLVGWALERLAGESGEAGYFTSLPPSLDLVETLAASLDELEEANVQSTVELARRVAPPEKAAELVKLVRYCRGARMKAGLAGIGDIHTAALEALRGVGPDLPTLLLPVSLGDDFSAMEWAFVARWPEEFRLPLMEDASGHGDIATFVADSPINEVREVFRRIQADGLSLDSVEIICVDSAAYVAALCSVGLEVFGGGPEELPLTFNSGIPGLFSRPGRLLAAWLEWLEQGLPAEGLARMIDGGLLPRGWTGGLSASALAAKLRALPINGDPDEYRRGLAGGDGAAGEAERWLSRLLTQIIPLAKGEPALSDPVLLLDAAESLLALPSPHDARLDAYAKSALLDAIREWRAHSDWPGFDPLSWLIGLCGNLHVMGLGPLPGMAHVGDPASGGHSGRRNTFILGLDDSRFPGSSRQDPVLLDRDRAGISPQLRKSGQRLRQREKTLARLFARLRGRVTASHSRLDAASGRELFPAAAFVKLAEGARRAGVNLTPDRPEKSLGRRDDWLWLVMGGETRAPSIRDLAPRFPGLAAGQAAVDARESARFTEYDGNVPEAGGEFAPATGRVFSPTDLELLAACPMDYFFKRVLKVVPPERYDPAPGRWLEGNQRGTLLHDLFQGFLDRLQKRGETLNAASRARHLELLFEMLDLGMKEYRRKFPPRDTLALRREVAEMEEAAVIFFLTEEQRQAAAEPLHREVKLGGGGKARTPWDREEPVAVNLPGGEAITLKGRIDRVDRLDGGGLFILDYKTGASGKFAASKPFRQGRNLQPYLYAMMLERALADLGLPETVRRFAYFFPMPRDEGRVIAYERDALADAGMVITGLLGRMLAQGCFPFTTNPDDAVYSDYAPIHGDAKYLASRARRKMEADPQLSAWAELRGMDI